MCGVMPTRLRTPPALLLPARSRRRLLPEVRAVFAVVVDRLVPIGRPADRVRLRRRRRLITGRRLDQAGARRLAGECGRRLLVVALEHIAEDAALVTELGPARPFQAPVAVVRIVLLAVGAALVELARQQRPHIVIRDLAAGATVVFPL